MIDRSKVEKLDDFEYFHFVNSFCRDIILSPSFNGKLTPEQLDEAEFLMRNGIRRVEKGSGSYYFVQGSISKLQLIIVFGYRIVADVPDWVYGWKED